MKIAISGAANTGKSTLAKDLARATSLPLIPERFNELPRRSREDKAGNQLAAAFQRLHSVKLELEQDHPDGFVTDRCPLDIFNYWTTFPVLTNRPESFALYKDCRSHMETYDFIVFLTWGSIVYSEVEAGKPCADSTLMNPWQNLARHASTLGLAHIWVPAERIIVVPGDVTDREERVKWLLDRFAEREGQKKS